MPGPKVDPSAPKPRIAPAVVASGLTIIALVGAIVIYMLGRAGLSNDQADIRRYSPVALTRVDTMQAALDSFESDGVGALEVLRDSASCELGSEALPGILEPLKGHCDAAAEAILALANRLAMDRPGNLKSLVEAASEAILATRIEVEDLRCLARIECISLVET